MKIKRINIAGFKSIRTLEIDPDHQVNLIVGTNGSGKSSILQALTIGLSWFTARMRNAKSNGMLIQADEINNQSDDACIEIELDNAVTWTLYKQKATVRKKTGTKTDLSKLNIFVSDLVNSYDAEPNLTRLPVIVGYSVDRAVTEVPLRIQRKHLLDPMSIYSGQLMGAINFRAFFEWFREREDLENEHRRDDTNFTSDKQLDAVRSAINRTMPGYSNLRVKRNPRRIVLDKEGVEFRLEQLSDGEKCYLALIADIARRLAIANPGLSDPLTGDGIIMIDEVDLHLHPAWQKEVVPRLKETFPNCQFFLSTHSPHVVSNIRNYDNEQLIVLNNGDRMNISFSSFGKNADRILTEFFSLASTRNSEAQQHIDQAWRLVKAGEYTGEALRNEIAWLEDNLQEPDAAILSLKAEIARKTR